MHTKGRALFNLVRMNWIEDPEVDAEPWQIESYRDIPLETLFSRLKELDIVLDQESFLHYAIQCDTPEQLAETLWVEEEEVEGFDQCYLLVFELWRRLLPQKQTLSIFCDELDHLISAYDQEMPGSDEALQEALSDLQRLLDESVDQGQNPKEVFRAISEYLAHDLECFIFDFAAEHIDEGHQSLASELIDGFNVYVSNGKWFLFLRARLLYDIDEEEGHLLIERIIEEEIDFELLLEICRFLASVGERALFIKSVNLAREYIATEEDFQELLALTCEFLRASEYRPHQETLETMLDRRQTIPLEKEITSKDTDLSIYYDLIGDLDGTEV